MHSSRTQKTWRIVMKLFKNLVPVKVFSIYFSYGWWFGKYAIFSPGGYWVPVIIPRYRFENEGITLAKGKEIPKKAYTSIEYRNNYVG